MSLQLNVNSARLIFFHTFMVKITVITPTISQVPHPTEQAARIQDMREEFSTEVRNVLQTIHLLTFGFFLEQFKSEILMEGKSTSRICLLSVIDGFAFIYINSYTKTKKSEKNLFKRGEFKKKNSCTHQQYFQFLQFVR